MIFRLILYIGFQKGKKNFLGLLIFSMVFSSQNLNAQDQLDYKTVDRETYRFYLLKEWDSLIDLGNRAIGQEIDYFFLRQRMGIAFYEKEKFWKAAGHFHKASKFNAQDPTTHNYLYYSFKFSNRLPEARYLREKYSYLLESRINEPDIGFFDKLYFETGYTFSNSFPDDNDKLIRPGSPYTERNLNGDRFYAQLSAGFNLNKRIGVYVGYSNLITSRLRQIQIPDGTLPANQEAVSKYNDEYNLYQHSLYGNANILVGEGYILTPGVHLLQIHYHTIFPVINTNGLLEIHPKDTSFANYAASLSISKNISLFNFNLCGTLSNLNGENQYQVGGKVTFFPQGNLNFYLTTTLSLLWDMKDSKPVFDQLVGFKLSPKLWLEGYATFGGFVNFVEKNAFIIHNSGDKTNFRVGGNLIIPLSEKIEFSIRYIFLNLESQTVWYRDGLVKETEINNYQNHTILGGLKWKF